MINTEKTNNGWIDTVVTQHVIKICKRISDVQHWNAFNKKHPEIGKNRLECGRCKTLWTTQPADGGVYVCMMEKEINRCICDQCASEINHKLILTDK